MRHVSLIFLVFLAIQTAGQGTGAIRFNPISDSTFNKYIQDWPCYAETEDVKIDVRGLYSTDMRIYLTQKTTVVIQSSDAEKCLSLLTLPLSLDPAARIIAPLNEKLSSDWSGIRNQKMDATLIRDYKPRPLKLNVNVRPVETGSYKYGVSQIVPEHVFYGENDYYDYTINEDLMPGDTLIFEISYNVDLAENIDKLLNFRYFFHRNYPIRKASLEIDVLKSVWFECETYNFSQPDTIYTVDASKKYFFDFSNLTGAFSEPNIYAWRELPYALIVFHPANLWYTIPNTLEEKPIPQYAIFAEYRDFSGRSIRLDISQGVNNKESIGMRRFLEKCKKDNITRESTIDNVAEIHNSITESFIYSNDSAYYKNEITSGPNYGESTNAGVLREFFRYEPYKYMLEDFKLMYFFGFLSDKRSGLISKQYITPISQDDYLLLILRDSVHYDIIYPKMQKTGYYYNELPFYYEGTDIASVHYTDYFLDPKNQRALPDTLYISKTPKSGILDNTRKFTILATISTAEKKIGFKCRGALSGQFSTLCRGSYLNNEVHPFVDSAYAQRIFDIPDAALVGKPIYTPSVQKPFRFGIDCSYQTPLKTESENIQIDLRDWFPYILPKPGAHKRTTNLYTDFLFTDIFIYQLVFDQEVVLSNVPKSFNIDNGYGKFMFSITEANNTTYTISAQLIVNHEMLRPDKIHFLNEIAAAVNEIDNTILVFRKK